VSAFGELLREIMPAWLSRQGKDSPGRNVVRPSRRPRQKSALGESPDDPQSLSKQADAVWQECIDEDRHGEAFPEPVGSKLAGLSGKRKPGNERRTQVQPSRKQ
jgi:hypothetical protein